MNSHNQEPTQKPRRNTLLHSKKYKDRNHRTKQRNLNADPGSFLWQKRMSGKEGTERGVNNETNCAEKTPTLEKDLRLKTERDNCVLDGLIETRHSSW